MAAAPVLARALWALALLVPALVCGGAGAAHAVGDWRWPLQPTPRVARPFDPPSKVWSAGHRGVDLAGQPGQAVLAPAGGRVAFTGTVAGRGVVSVLTPGGLRTTFEPVAAAVRVGEAVEPGQVLGHLQLTRGHCLPAACLHWGVRTGPEAYLDPLDLLGRPDIVLLPFLDGTGADPVVAGPVVAGPVVAGPVVAGSPVSGAAAMAAGWSVPAPFAGPTDGASRAVSFALAQIDDPYEWAASGPDRWDCSGLTMGAWAVAGVHLPHSSAAQFLASTPVAESQLRPGDLVFWSTGGPDAIFHVALYLGDGLVVHAPRTGTRVRVEGMRTWDEPDYFGRV